jgi:hypothetical protein
MPVRPQACERLLSACSTLCRQPPASCNKTTGWTRAALAGVEGLRSLTYVHALPLHIKFRDLHCIARASVEDGSKKHVSSPPRWREATQRSGKKRSRQWTANSSANFRSHLVPMYTSNPNPSCTVLVTRHSCHTTYSNLSRHVLRSGKLPLL